MKRIRVGYCSAGKARRAAQEAERPTARKAHENPGFRIGARFG